MPQLEFTIWLSNAAVNWIVVLVFILFINNSVSTFTNYSINSDFSNTSHSNNNWPW
uniref:ATP synthase F0 subunit 8 n=1 Tax=Ophiothrix exigua TaxID=1815227 RepID=UPI00286B9F81|nr:ATP synthase F0 subunit 8 [Ophiothrix exigua]WKW95558.1 ATP synthase F0 subunit 8 [Ophiothrix exigua]